MDAQSRRWYHGSRELWLWPIGPKGPTFVASSQPPLAAGRSSTSGLIANPRRKRTNRQQGTWGHFYISAVLHRSGQVRIRSQQSRDTSHTSHTSRIWKQVIDCIRWWDLGSGHKKSMPRFWGFHDVSFGFVPVTGSTWPGSHAGNPGAGDDGRIWRDGGNSENLHDLVVKLGGLLWWLFLSQCAGLPVCCTRMTWPLEMLLVQCLQRFT